MIRIFFVASYPPAFDKESIFEDIAQPALRIEIAQFEWWFRTIEAVRKMPFS